MKILVADDDAVSRLLMERILRRKGLEVIAASDGSEAVELLLQDEGPRLVLLDWTMPELNGPEVCKAVRSGSRAAYVYITLLTSRDSKEDLVAGLEAGADDYLIKPCHPEELWARLRVGQRILQLEDILVSARDDMHRRATHDPLTQLLNRGAILDALGRRLVDVRSSTDQFGVMLCDIDHFKAINDTYGHSVGDEVLCGISRSLKSLAHVQQVGRYGGEEFLLLLQGRSHREIETAAERICSSIRSTPIFTAVGPLSITLSGGAVFVGPRLRDLSSHELIRRADELLYRAKREGRDRTIAFAPTEQLALA